MIINCLRAAPRERSIHHIPIILPPILLFLCFVFNFHINDLFYQRNVTFYQRPRLLLNIIFIHLFPNISRPQLLLKNTKTKWKKKNLHKHPLTRINTTKTT